MNLRNTSMNFGVGRVLFSDTTNLVEAFVDSSHPDRRFLLGNDLVWHDSDHSWGTGYIISNRGSRDWGAPQTISVEGDVQLLHYLFEKLNLALNVSRRGGDNKYTERYVWKNQGSESIEITGLGIETPFADYYPSAEESLNELVNTHVFIGGSWSWVLAQPMSGQGLSLGLIVRKGSLESYSIESRNTLTQSNIRGHIVLQVTDYAHNPESFGSQPRICLKPGEEYVLEWEIGLYANHSEFIEQTDPPVSLSSPVEYVGNAITVTTCERVRVDSQSAVLSRVLGNIRITAPRVSDTWIRIGEHAKTEITFVHTLEDSVRLRSKYIINNQSARGRIGVAAGAFLPTDTRTSLPVKDGGWQDWTDGSERVGMALMMQRGRNCGLLGEEVDGPLAAWSAFAQEYLIDSSGRTRRGSTRPSSDFGQRFYDVPWLAEFFIARFEQTGDKYDLDESVKLLNTSFKLGGGHFLAIGLSSTVEEVVEQLRGKGRENEAKYLENEILKSATYFLSRGDDLPGHEVDYEQSIVAPLINLLIDANRISGESKYFEGIKKRLPWLLSFGGPQPNGRQQWIPIRHWDGYWFGINKLFGDVFPHHWAALTAEVIARLPKELKTEELSRMAIQIMKETMINYNEDGSATCAFVYPSNVDERPAHVADPLANDQDWPLAIWMRLIEREGFKKH